MRAVTVSVLCVVLTAVTAHAEPSKPTLALVNVAADAGAGQTKVREVRRALADATAFSIADESAALEAPLPPRADDPRIRQLSEKVAAARSAFLKFEFDSALELTDSAEQVALSLPPSAATTEALVDINLVRAKLHDANKREPQTVASLQMVARLRPELRQLDAAKYTPRLRKLYVKARARLSTTTATVRVNPPNSRVWVGGRVVDVSQGIELSKGKNYVRATALGYEPRGIAHDFVGAKPRLVVELVEADKMIAMEAVRRVLVGADAPKPDHLAKLADLGGADLLVLVRSSGELLVYDRRDQSTSKWAPQSDQPLLEPAAKIDDGPNADRPDLTATSEPRDSSRSWYTTWWGIGGMAVGAAAVGTLVYFAIKPDVVYGIGDIGLQ